MKIRKNSHRAPGKPRPGTSKAALPALVAAAGGLVIGSASALELGELQVQSTLGQPLRASLAYALGPDEIINGRCVSVRPAGRDLPGLHNASVRISQGFIAITGGSPVVEPMLSANIVVDCPYSPHVSRSYLLFIDPQERPPAAARQPAPAAVPAGASARPAAPAPRPVPVAAPIAPQSRYRVQPGDSLSGIVHRLEGRDASSSAAMAAIVSANPAAFINGDPDRLKAGSLLDIPPLPDDAGALAHMAAPPPRDAVSDDGEAATAAARLYQGAESLQPGASRQAAATGLPPEIPQSVDPETADAATESADTTTAVVDQPAEEADYSAAYKDLVAGDVVVDDAAATRAAPAEAAAPPTRAAKPSAATRIVGSPEPAGFPWNWLIWAAVALISAFGSYLMFWPKLREHFGSKPVGADDGIPPQAEQPAPIRVPDSAMTVQEIKPTLDNVDFDLSDDSPTEENLVIDADLVEGTGLEDSDDVDVNRDFGFAATMDLDLELPEAAAAEDPAPETDIIPPPERPEEDFIVDSEVLPEGDEDEYDISMVVDATKMPDPAEVTECDLRAVPLDDTGQASISDDYTIVDEIGQDILEKDYEDELSTSQLLNAEIEKAASELAESLGEGGSPAEAEVADDDDAGRIVASDDDTSIAMQLTDVSELDLTATLEAQNDDVGDDLDITATIEADDETVEMPRDKDGTRTR